MFSDEFEPVARIARRIGDGGWRGEGRNGRACARRASLLTVACRVPETPILDPTRARGSVESLWSRNNDLSTCGKSSWSSPTVTVSLSFVVLLDFRRLAGCSNTYNFFPDLDCFVDTNYTLVSIINFANVWIFASTRKILYSRRIL